MNHQSLAEGDLIAYLAGEPAAHVEAVLLEASDRQRELAELVRLDQWLSTTVGATDQLDPQDLVDVVAGQATPNQRLQVAAFLRNSEPGRQAMAALEAERSAFETVTRAWRLRLPQFLAAPLQAAFALRSLETTTAQQTFYVAEIKAQVTVRVAPMGDELWQIEGYVTQEFVAVANAPVILSTGDVTQTDEAGFFTITHLSNGSYTCQVYLTQGTILLEQILIQDPDE
jgi:hypothetical protein